MRGWFLHHWKTIAIVVGSTVVFVGVTALTGGLGAPALLALAAGGFASGTAGYAGGQLLDHESVGLKEALFAGFVSTVVTVGTAGVGRFLTPFLDPAVAGVTASLAPKGLVPAIVRTTAADAATGAVLGALGKVGENALEGKPWTDDLAGGAEAGAINGILTRPATRLLGVPLFRNGRAIRGGLGEELGLPPPLPEPPTSRGLVRQLDGLMEGNEPGTH